MVSVNWELIATKDLTKIDAVIVERILRKVSWMRDNFNLIVPEKLHRDLVDCYKLRIGDYRVVYEIKENIINILRVGHRREIYKL